MTDTRFIHRIFTDERVEAWRDRYFWVNSVTAALGLGSFLVYHGKGFPDAWDPWIALFQALCLVVLIGETLGVYYLSRTLKEGWRQSPTDSIALLIGLLMGLGLFISSHWVSGFLTRQGTFEAFAYLTQAGLLAFVVVRLMRLVSFVTRLVQNPLLVLAGSFATLILIGTGLLLLPGAHAPGQDISFLDALFTATSATCVTGLIVVDTPEAWSRFGHLVIITLVQIGGLGIMAFAVFFGMAFGRGMGVRDASAAGEILNMRAVGRVGRVAVGILVVTVVIEAVGVWLLYGRWVDDAGEMLPASDQLFYSIFHSISAFCNAGFALYDDSMVRFVGDWPLVLSISGLVIMGGLGFLVIMECSAYRFWAHPFFRRFGFVRRRVKNQKLPRLSLQSKVVLLATGILLVAGTLGFLVLEWNYTLAELTFNEKLAAAGFQSMTSRTAGFNTVDTGAMSQASHFWTVILMLIGGSPGSVAGGIKTTTFIIMVLALIATIRGRPTEIFQRRIPEDLTRKSLVMLVVMTLLVCAVTLGLTLTEANGAGAGDRGFERILFEATSACCTVGLSMGITSELTGPGQVITIIGMYIGRIGPLTLVLAISRRHPQRYEYPEESMMVG